MRKLLTVILISQVFIYYNQETVMNYKNNVLCHFQGILYLYLYVSMFQALQLIVLVMFGAVD